MTSGQEDSHDPVLIWHIPDLALSSFTFLFLCAIAIGRTKRWDSFLSVSAVLRGHLIDNSLCRKKNNEHSSPRRFYSDRGCDRKERIWHNHHTRACLWVTNHKNNNAVHIHALPEDKLAPGLPADTSCECLNWPDSPQRSSALEIDWLIGCVCSIEIQWYVWFGQQQMESTVNWTGPQEGERLQINLLLCIQHRTGRREDKRTRKLTILWLQWLIE